MRRKSNYILKICLIVAFTAGIPNLPVLGQRSAQQTFVSSNNRKAVLYNDGRLVFYDGIGQNARSIIDVNCLKQRVISSQQGKYFATCSQFINKTGPARIYNENGKKIGEFDLELPWKVEEISNNGDLIALHQVLDGSSPHVVRFCDLKGNILEEFDKSRYKFALNGMPVIWGVKSSPENNLFFVSILDNKGKIIDEYQSLDYIREIQPSKQAEIILIVHKMEDNRITIWNRLNDSTKTIEIMNGLDNIHSPEISSNGQYAVVRVFREEISLIDTVNCSEVLHKTIDEPLSNSFKTEVILQVAVSNSGNILVMGYSAEGVVGYCVLDKSGKMIKSKVLENFGNDGRTGGRFRIQELSGDKFAIVHKKNKYEIIDL